MTSVTNIANRALQSIGTRSTISALTEQSPEARNFNLIYEDTRDEVLSMAHWNFTRKTAILSLLKQAPGTPGSPSVTAMQWSSLYPSPPWLYEYAYNSDCLQMRYIMGQWQYNTATIPIMSNNGQAPYLTDMAPTALWIAAGDVDSNGNQINVVLTNQYQAIGVYTQRITNPALFSPLFVQALVAACAAKLAMSLTGDKDLAKLKFAEANAWITQARATDGNEGLTVIANEASWMLARASMGEGNHNGYYVADFSPLYAT
jgi:hypothetical protein